MRAAPRAAHDWLPELSLSAPHGFPRTARLTRRAEFNRVFSKGRRIRTRYFTLIAAPANESARLGLAIGRRCDRRAVERNRIKRMIRDVFRQTDLPAFDVVVTASARAARQPNQSLRRDLRHGLGKLR